MPVLRAGGLLFAAWLLSCAFAAHGGQPGGGAERELIREAELTAEEAAAEARESDRDRKWIFALYNGIQWDDNIILEGDGVDVEDTEQTDWKSIHVLQADFRAVNTEDHVLGLRYRLYQSFIDVNNELQLTGHTLTGYYTTMRSPNVLFVPVSYSRYNLYWHEYLDLFSLAPSIYMEHSSHFVGVLRMGCRVYDYSDVPDNGFDEDDRDSTVLSVGLEEWYIFGEKAQYRLELGYTFEREITADAAWAYASHKVRLGAGAELPWWDLSVGGYAAYEGRGYDALNPAFDETQEEDIITCGLSVSRPLGRDATLTIGYAFTDNDSNVESQDYERSQVTLGVTLRF
ncbi:MAG: surface lipoprotein assembly modifier [Planctomycetota bacterium]|jgi:hypothetical protein